MEQPAKQFHELRVNPRQTAFAYELQTFVFLTLFLAPIVSVVLIGSYGFLIWFFQILG